MKLGIMLSTLIFAALLVASLAFDWSPKHHFEYILCSLFIVGSIFVFIRKYYYIYYNGDGAKIVLRYTSIMPLSVGNFSIEIQKRDFVKKEIVSSFFGLRKSLILYVNTPQGLAKFKPISLSTLSRDELSALLKELSIFEK